MKSRITEAEKQLLKDTFKNNETLMIAVRKIFLPEFDANAPIGTQIDLYLNLELDNLSPEQVWIQMKARDLFIKQVETGLNAIDMIANNPTPTTEEIKKRAGKNSAE